LHQYCIYDRCAGRIAQQHRHVILLQADLLLDLMAQVFEVACDQPAGGLAAQAAQVVSDVYANHDGAVVTKRLRHVDDAEIPTSISREKNRNALGSAGGDVDADHAETAGGHQTGRGLRGRWICSE